MNNKIQEDRKKVLSVLNTKKVLIPILFSLLFVFFLIIKDPNFNLANLALVKNLKLGGLILACLCLILKDSFFVWRIKLLTENTLSWKTCLVIVLLWEFSSAVTPSAVGGTFVAVFLFMNAGISLGKSLAYVMGTAVFDNLFFIILGPLGFNYAFSDPVFASANHFIEWPFWVSYILIAGYTAFMGGSLFIAPKFFKWIIVGITNLKFLKKYKPAAEKQGDDIILASKFMNKKGFSFWIVIMFITFATWIMRYCILNCLAGSTTSCSFSDHINIFSRHLVMWVTMLISPTPGSSGTAEYIFNDMYDNILGNYTIIITLLWRLLTYYVYLVAGALILPRWVKTIKKS